MYNRPSGRSSRAFKVAEKERANGVPVLNFFLHMSFSLLFCDHLAADSSEPDDVIQGAQLYDSVCIGRKSSCVPIWRVISNTARCRYIALQ
jgi:hypothetical protein